MKILSPQIIFFTLVSAAQVCGTSSNQIEQLSVKPSQQWNWGVATNGIVGGILIEQILKPHEEFKVKVYLHEAFDTNAVPPTFYSEPNGKAFHFFDFNEYYKATNGFCGVLELREDNGHELPILKPEIYSTQAYPVFFSKRQMWEDQTQGRPAILISPRMPEPLIGRIPQIASFNLKDYFNLNHTGEYLLTIWPKIYKQSATNDDLCERIDLPPVTATVKWDGAAPVK